MTAGPSSRPTWCLSPLNPNPPSFCRYFSSSVSLSSLELSDKQVHESQIRAFLGTGVQFYEVVVLADTYIFDCFRVALEPRNRISIARYRISKYVMWCLAFAQ